MAIRWLPAVTVVLWLGGCGFESPPPPDPSPQPRTADKPAAVPQPPAVEQASPAVAKKPAAKEPRPAEKKPALRTTDDFGFPLVIVIDAPEVPKELLGPSPPIQEPLKPAPKPKPPVPKPASPPPKP